MADDLVLDINSAERTVALLDRFGAHHVAVAHAELPATGTFLQGGFAVAGQNTLISEGTGQVYCLAFAAVDCGQEATFDMLHTRMPMPMPVAGQFPTPSHSSPAFRRVRHTDTWEGSVPPGRR